MDHGTWVLVEIDLAGVPVVEIWARGDELAVVESDWPSEGPESGDVAASRPPGGSSG